MIEIYLLVVVMGIWTTLMIALIKITDKLDDILNAINDAMGS
jgi:hypothetical protein